MLHRKLQLSSMVDGERRCGPPETKFLYDDVTEKPEMDTYQVTREAEAQMAGAVFRGGGR